MKHFNLYTKEHLLAATVLRKFETRLGERVQVISNKESIREAIAATDARFVIFGIQEDLGVKANFGIGGADTTWKPFLRSFCNMQSNDFLEGSSIVLLGHFDFSEMEDLIEKTAPGNDEKVEALRHAVVKVDEEVEDLVKLISAAGKIPIAIGGGHNNAYPLIKGCAKGLYNSGKIPLAQINCINLDAHTDYRPMEGRHSGNGFRYAEVDGYLLKYSVIGIQESYLPQNILMDISGNPFINCISYEDIFIREKKSFIQAVEHAVGFTEDNFTGIELDLDAVENILSSAASPSGFTVLQARQFVSLTGQESKPAYLHICEGASRLDDGRSSDTIGKLISMLVCDFIKDIRY